MSYEDAIEYNGYGDPLELAEEYMFKSVVPCFCNECLVEDQAEPDAVFPCHDEDCDGIVRSIIEIVL